MEEKFIDLLISIAHISEKLKSLSVELDKIYTILTTEKLSDLMKGDK